MGRIIGIVLVVIAIYFAANYVTGGRIGGEDDASVRSTPQRAGDAVREAFEEGEQRRNDLLPE